MSQKHIWFRENIDRVLEHFEVSHEKGLTQDSIQKARQRHGWNRLMEEKPRSAASIFIAQFKETLILILLAAAVISYVIGEPQDVIAILAIVLLNGILGFVQEFRAQRALAALKQLSAPYSRVRREGHLVTVPAYELVPGDLVFLEAGNLVPADLRVIEAHRLHIDESALTGESLAVTKHSQALNQEQVALGDQANIAFKGTLVTGGRGLGVVIRTGMETELGRIAHLLRVEVEVKTPLQVRMGRLSRKLAWIVLSLCAIFFGIEVLQGNDPLDMLLTSVSLAVAAIPEALPAVMTVSLALGAARLSRQKALIRKLPAVEGLGSVTSICSDKTGTLTQNRMQVVEFFAPANEGRALETLVLNNDSLIDAKGQIQGDPTETALLEFAILRGLDPKETTREYPRVAEIPFSSESARMTTLHRSQNGTISLTKGAPETVLPLCKGLDRNLWVQELEGLTQRGLRVLALAQKKHPHSDVSLSEAERDLTWLGFVALMDTPRPEVRAALKSCADAGIKVTMITGDHPVTALAIAKELNWPGSLSVKTGSDLEGLTEEQWRNCVRENSLFARVAPEQKIHIVKAQQAMGEIVAMTGDGVNDAPALKRANIGVAMGLKGTDVAREAAHMILLDDNFATIVGAVREGRRIYDNLRKFVRFALAGNFGEILTLFLAPFLGLPIPLLPIHILWVNLVTDGLPGLALAVEPGERDLMKRPPRPARESLFSQGLWQHVVWVGFVIAALSLGTLLWAQSKGSANWQTMTFTVLTLAQMFHVMAIRSENDSLFRQGLFSNLPLLGAVLFTFGLQLLVIYLPEFNTIFHTTSLTLEELGFCFGISSLLFLAVETEKAIRRRSHSNRRAEAVQGHV